MTNQELPSADEMYRAVVARDGGYDGVFFTAVRTTGIFCRPTCSAKKPKPGNVEFFGTSRDALLAGYRPCLRCRPLEPRGEARELFLKLAEAMVACREPLIRADQQVGDGDHGLAIERGFSAVAKVEGLEEVGDAIREGKVDPRQFNAMFLYCPKASTPSSFTIGES